MLRLVFAPALAVAHPPASSAAMSPPSGHIVKVLAQGNGRSPETAYKVASVKEEYEIVRALGLEMAFGTK